jgi:hypothetical protein
MRCRLKTLAIQKLSPTMSRRRDELAYHLVRRGNRRRLRGMLRKHPELRTSAGAMLIYVAVWQNLGMLRWLLEHGVPPDSGAEAHGGNTPLMHAASVGDVRAMNLLLQFGANPNAVNANSENPLGYAATYEHPEAIKVLVAAGVDVNDTTDSGRGRTQLDIAEASGWAEVAATLRSLGGKRYAELHPITAPESAASYVP